MMVVEPTGLGFLQQGMGFSGKIASSLGNCIVTGAFSIIPPFGVNLVAALSHCPLDLLTFDTRRLPDDEVVTNCDKES